MDNVSAPTIKPYQFEGLPKLRSKDLQIEEALLSYLPFQLGGKPLKKIIEEFLSQQFREESKIYIEKIEESDFKNFVESLPEFCVVAQLSAQPLNSKAFIWFDYTFIFNIIHNLLGAKGQLPIELRSLSSLEEGVLEFLILKILSLFYQASDQDTAMHLRLETLHQGVKKLSSFQKQNSPSVWVHIRLQIGSQSTSLLVVLPHPLIEGMFLQSRTYSDDRNLEWNKQLLKKLSEISYVKAELLAEIGSVTLSIAEKNQLEKGDVILFDQSFCHFSDQHLAGNVILKIGDEAESGFLAQVVSADSPVLVKIIDYYGG